MLQGLAPDGGLFVPNVIPSLDGSSLRKLESHDWRNHLGKALLGDMLLAYDASKYKPELSPMVKACTTTRFLAFPTPSRTPMPRTYEED